jgi:hypothetical protein
MSYDTDEFSFADEYAAAGDELLGKAYPAGTYTMLVSKMEPKVTAGNKRAFVVTLEFTEGKHRGKKLSEQMTWSPESDVAMRIFAQGLQVMGADQAWIKTAKPTPRQICDRCVGSVIEVALTEDEWGGQERNRVRFNKRLSGGGKGSGTTVANKPIADDLSAESEDLAPAPAPAGVGGSDDDAGLNWP